MNDEQAVQLAINTIRTLSVGGPAGQSLDTPAHLWRWRLDLHDMESRPAFRPRCIGPTATVLCSLITIPRCYYGVCLPQRG